MSKNFIYSSLVGTLVYFLLGWLVYGFIFPEIHPDEAEPQMINIFLGCLFYAFFFAAILTRWAGISTAKIGFYVGFTLAILHGISWHFFYLTEAFSMMKLVKEVVIEGALTGVMAATIAYVNGSVLNATAQG